MPDESRRAHLERCMIEAMAEPLETHPRPWNWGVGYRDGWFFQFFDAAGEKILGDSIRDPEDAALLLRTINAEPTRIAELEAELSEARAAAEFMRQQCTCARVSEADIDRAVEIAQAMAPEVL